MGDSSMSRTSTKIADEIQAIIAALVAGARYGTKIRLPHSLVMTFLFRRELSSTEKIRSIIRTTLEHASNLGAFAAVYKTILAILKRSSRNLRQIPISEKSLGQAFLSLIVNGPFSFQDDIGNVPVPSNLVSMAGLPERPYHAWLAGALGGYFVWGRSSSINQQVVLYLSSRVLVGLTKRVWEHYHEAPHQDSIILRHRETFPLLAAIVWGIVMVLFEESPHVLQWSLRKSMNEIYRFRLKN